MTTTLIKPDEVTRALAQANTVEEIKKIHDLGAAYAVYAKRQRAGLVAQNAGAEIQIRAARKAGEILKQLDKSDGGRPAKNSTNVGTVSEYREVLEETDTPIQTAGRWQQIAAIPEETFEEFIAEKKAAGEELTTTAVLKVAKDIEREIVFEEKHSRPFPVGLYQVVYADPPWSYDNSGFNQSAASQYPTMPTADIADLPVSGITSSASVLFLWATSPLLADALTVMRKWGFDYKASMIWVKNRAPGIGWWVQTYHELLLIGSREETPHPLIKPPSVVTADVSVHSRKPFQFYELIESMYTGPKVELFGRLARPGWETWGNENV